MRAIDRILAGLGILTFAALLCAPGTQSPRPIDRPGKPKQWNVRPSTSPDAAACYAVGHLLDDPDTCGETQPECCSTQCSGSIGSYHCCGPNSDYACVANSDCCSDSCGVGTPGFCD